MSLNLTYSVREAVLGFRRARVAAFLTVATMAVVFTLLEVFLVFTVNIQHMMDVFREKMALEVFIQNSLSGAEVRVLQNRIAAVPGVEGVAYISREEALRRYEEELGTDLMEILGENPLPASFQISLERAYRTSSRSAAMVQTLEALSGVDEVVYHGRLFQAVDRYSRIVLWADLFLLLTVFFASVLLVSNTLRLTILTHRRDIGIMELVGATQGFIRRPYVIQGIVQGVLGGGIAALLVWILVQIVSVQFPQLLNTPPWVFLFPVVLGLILGFAGSRLSIQRYLKG